MKPTLVDCLLLAQPFIFRSELSPAECAARLDALNGRLEDNTLWSVTVYTSPDTQNYTFELSARTPYEVYGRSQVSLPHGSVSGSITAGDKSSESHVAGVKRIPARISVAVGVIALLELILLTLLPNPQAPAFGGVLCMALYLPGLGVLAIVLALRRSQRMLNRLEQALQAHYFERRVQEPLGQWGLDDVRLTRIDRLLLGKAFSFRSELSPAECAARIEALTGADEDDSYDWVGCVELSLTTSDACRFDLHLLGEGFTRQQRLPQISIRGVIQPSGAAGGATISGRVSLARGSLVRLVLTLIPLLILLVIGSHWRGFALYMLMILLVLAGVVMQSLWEDRQRTLMRLEQSLQASYPAKKATRA